MVGGAWRGLLIVCLLQALLWASPAVAEPETPGNAQGPRSYGTWYWYNVQREYASATYAPTDPGDFTVISQSGRRVDCVDGEGYNVELETSCAWTLQQDGGVRMAFWVPGPFGVTVPIHYGSFYD